MRSSGAARQSSTSSRSPDPSPRARGGEVEPVASARLQSADAAPAEGCTTRRSRRVTRRKLTPSKLSAAVSSDERAACSSSTTSSGRRALESGCQRMRSDSAVSADGSGALARPRTRTPVVGAGVARRRAWARRGSRFSDARLLPDEERRGRRRAHDFGRRRIDDDGLQRVLAAEAPTRDARVLVVSRLRRWPSNRESSDARLEAAAGSALHVAKVPMFQSVSLLAGLTISTEWYGAPARLRSRAAPACAAATCAARALPRRTLAPRRARSLLRPALAVSE